MKRFGKHSGRSVLDSWRGPLVALALASTAIATTGCRITEEDVHKWANKAQGPRKLVAVLSHDKYSTDLRVEAGMTMIRMKPRGGQQIGLQGSDEFTGLIEALDELPATESSQLIEKMTPQLVAEMTKKPAQDEPDDSFPYKDAAYALLTHEGGALITDAALRDRLMKALVQWSNTNFDERLDNTSQIYGMEQVLRLTKADGVRGLTGLIAPNEPKIDTVARMISELGDDKTKLLASQKLVKVAQQVSSDDWKKEKAPQVKKANEASGLEVKPKAFEYQLEQYQEEELLRVFGSMKKVGQKPIVDYLLAYAQDPKHSETRRAAALAALEGNLDRKDPSQAKILLDLLSSDETPDKIRDVASRRVGELPRGEVAERLFGMFDNKRWQVRWVAASLLLKMSDAKDIPEFMERLGKTEDFALTEPLNYGPLLHDVRGEKPLELVERYSKKNNPVEARLTALGYWYRYGSKADLSKIEPFESDSERVPKCGRDATDCDWQCTVTEGKTRTAKEIETVGDYVSYCIRPALSSREPEPTTAQQSDAGK